MIKTQTNASNEFVPTIIHVPIPFAGKQRLQLHHKNEYPDTWSIFSEVDIAGPGVWEVDISKAKKYIQVRSVLEAEAAVSWVGSV